MATLKVLQRDQYLTSLADGINKKVGIYVQWAVLKSLLKKSDDVRPGFEPDPQVSK